MSKKTLVSNSEKKKISNLEEEIVVLKETIERLNDELDNVYDDINYVEKLNEEFRKLLKLVL